MRRLAIAIALLGALTATPVLAQDPTAAPSASPPASATPTPPVERPLNPAILEGVVYNIDGQVFADVPVTAALAPEPGGRPVKATVNTDAEGEFSFAELPPGNYFLAIGDTSVVYRNDTSAGSLVVRTFFNSITSVSIYMNDDGVPEAEDPVVTSVGPAEPTPRPVDQLNPFTVALEQALAVEYQPEEFGVVGDPSGPGILGTLMLLLIVAGTITLATFTWYVTVRLPTVSRYRGNTT